MSYRKNKSRNYFKYYSNSWISDFYIPYFNTSKKQYSHKNKQTKYSYSNNYLTYDQIKKIIKRIDKEEIKVLNRDSKEKGWRPGMENKEFDKLSYKKLKYLELLKKAAEKENRLQEYENFYWEA